MNKEAILEYLRQQDPLHLQLGTFAAIAGVLFILGWLFTSLGRRRKTATGRPAAPLILGPFTYGMAGVLPQSDESYKKISREVKQAGYYRQHALQNFLAFRNTLVIGWMMLVAAVLWIAYDSNNDPTPKILIGGALGTIACFVAPRIILQTNAKRRVQRIQAGLPDALDMVSMCLTGGIPLQAALERVSSEIKTSHPDVAEEFEIISRQSEAHTLEHALNHFADRMNIPDVSAMAALVTQTEKLGTSVAVALRDYADSVRRSYRQRAEEKGNRASVMMLLPVALCLAPPVYILLLAPAVLELREFVIRENKPGGVLATDMQAAASRQIVRGQPVGPAVDAPRSFMDPSPETMDRLRRVGRPGRLDSGVRALGTTPAGRPGAPAATGDAVTTPGVQPVN